MAAFHTTQIVGWSNEAKSRHIGWIDAGEMCCSADLLETIRRFCKTIDEHDHLNTVCLAPPKADNRSFITVLSKEPCVLSSTLTLVYWPSEALHGLWERCILFAL